MIGTFITLLGFCLVMQYVKDILHALYVLFVARDIDLQKKYGKGSWALITGGSEGIGLAVAKELARKGINIVIVARNQEKLEKARAEILEVNHKIKCEVRSFDFNTLSQKGEATKVMQSLDLKESKYDISILFNNVGMANRGKFTEASSYEIQRLITVNCTSQAVMTHALLPRLRKRKQDSAIISTSSMSTIHPFPRYDLYGASKSFNSYFAQCFPGEVGVDSYTFIPAFVKTALSRSKNNFFMISPEECARDTVKFIGRWRSTFCGHWKHEMLRTLLMIIPRAILFKLVLKLTKRKKK